jgi:hypothetical protein
MSVFGQMQPPIPNDLHAEASRKNAISAERSPMGIAGASLVIPDGGDVPVEERDG